MSDELIPTDEAAETPTDEVVVETEVEVTVETDPAENEPTEAPSEDPAENPAEDPEEAEEPAEVEEATEGLNLEGLTRPEAEDAIRTVIQAAGIPYNSVVFAKGVITVECLGNKPAEPLAAALGLDLMGAPIRTGVVPGTVGRTVFKFEV